MVMESGAAATVSPVVPETPLSVAEIVVVPAPAPVANPLALMVAATELEEAQVTPLVRIWVLPLE